MNKIGKKVKINRNLWSCFFIISKEQQSVLYWL
jgi:hypothetical protein